jgi:putative ABC transport system substrate-binding protein
VKRRDLLRGAVTAATVASFRAAAQPGLPIVGYLSSRSAEAETPTRTGFLDGLERAGFVAGRDVVIEYRFAEGHYDRLPSLAAELVGLPAAMVIATEVPSAVAAKKTTATTPIVFASGQDPVQLGLVESLSRPAGNATGIAAFTTRLGPKRLEMMRDLLPQSRYGPLGISRCSRGFSNYSGASDHGVGQGATHSHRNSHVCAPGTWR